MKTQKATEITYIYGENGKLLRVIMKEVVIDGYYNIIKTLKTIPIFSPFSLNLHFFANSGLQISPGYWRKIKTMNYGELHDTVLYQ